MTRKISASQLDAERCRKFIKEFESDALKQYGLPEDQALVSQELSYCKREKNIFLFATIKLGNQELLFKVENEVPVPFIKASQIQIQHIANLLCLSEEEVEMRLKSADLLV